MIHMSKVNIDYAGNEVWASNKCFLAKERVPQHFEKSDVSKYRQLGNVLVHKTTSSTGYIMRAHLMKPKG